MNKDMLSYIGYFIFYWASKIITTILSFKLALHFKESSALPYPLEWLILIMSFFIMFLSYNLKFPMIKYYNTFKNLTFKEKIKFVQIGGNDE